MLLIVQREKKKTKAVQLCMFKCPTRLCILTLVRAMSVHAPLRFVRFPPSPCWVYQGWNLLTLRLLKTMSECLLDAKQSGGTCLSVCVCECVYLCRNQVAHNQHGWKLSWTRWGRQSQLHGFVTILACSDANMLKQHKHTLGDSFRLFGYSLYDWNL